MKLSVIVPMLNEESAIGAALRALREGAPDAELIVVDGGSTDLSRERAGGGCDLLIEAPRGRARQLNAGAGRAGGDALAFVHADTIVPPSFARDIENALSDPGTVGGRFDIRLDQPGAVYRMIGALISLRSRLSRTATGDQAIFVRRELFERLGGFPMIELCEDVEFSWRLKRAGRIACLRSRVSTSARRWQRRGVIRTIVTMWAIRLLCLAGVSPARLRSYYPDAR